MLRMTGVYFEVHIEYYDEDKSYNIKSVNLLIPENVDSESYVKNLYSDLGIIGVHIVNPLTII